MDNNDKNIDIFAALLIIYAEIRYFNDSYYLEECYRCGTMTKTDFINGLKECTKVRNEQEGSIFSQLADVLRGKKEENDGK